MVEIKLQFKSVEEAITVLGKMAGLGEKKAPQAPAVPAGGVAVPPVSPAAAPSTQATTKGRKPRADAGQARGPNARTAQSNAGAPQQPETPEVKAAPPAPSGSSDAALAAPAPETAAPSTAPTIEQCQAALTKVFEAKGLTVSTDLMARFGVKRIKEMLPASYAEFIAKCESVLAGEAV